MYLKILNKYAHISVPKCTLKILQELTLEIVKELIIEKVSYVPGLKSERAFKQVNSV